jgi:ASC-1-like (ASCH) protein
MTHALKTLIVYYQHVVSGIKTFEVRLMDRPFKVGDKLLLQEFNSENLDYTGSESEYRITYIMTSEMHKAVTPGYCILAIEPWVKY